MHSIKEDKMFAFSNISRKPAISMRCASLTWLKKHGWDYNLCDQSAGLLKTGIITNYLKQTKKQSWVNAHLFAPEIQTETVYTLEFAKMV